MTDQQDNLDVPLGNPLEEAAVQEFAANFRGELIRPADEGYDTARAVFNAMIDRRPAGNAVSEPVAEAHDLTYVAREKPLSQKERGHRSENANNARN